MHRGFLYLLPLRRAEPIALTARLKNQVREAVSAIRAMIEREALPPPPARQAICVSCEFRNFCNDVL